MHARSKRKKLSHAYSNRRKLISAPCTARYSSLSAFFHCSHLSSSFTSRFSHFLPFFLSLPYLPPYSTASSSSFAVIHRLTSSFPVERVCSGFSSSSSRSLFAAVVFILSTVCHSICWQTHLFRVGHKRTMMSYFVSAQGARLIKPNLGRSTSLFVASVLFRAPHPLLPLSSSKRERIAHL